MYDTKKPRKRSFTNTLSTRTLCSWKQLLVCHKQRTYTLHGLPILFIVFIDQIDATDTIYQENLIRFNDTRLGTQRAKHILVYKALNFSLTKRNAIRRSIVYSFRIRSCDIPGKRILPSHKRACKAVNMC